MLYIKKSTIQPLAVASILLTLFNVGNANANELSFNPTSKNTSNVANTLQRSDKYPTTVCDRGDITWNN